MKEKRRIRDSISKRVFFITSSIFLGITIFNVLLQWLFFEGYYNHQKKKDLEKQVQSFKSEYEDKYTEIDLMQMMREYQQKYSITIAVVDSNGFYNMPSTQVPRVDSERLQLVRNIVMWFQNDPVGNKFIKESKDSKYELNTLAYVTTGSNDEYIIGITSLEQVNEAAGISLQLNLYFAIISVVILTFISVIYTNTISKPLVKINRVAKKIAQLDFTEKCVVDRNDEIGSLSESINIMSNNLGEALTSLKTANLKLKEDIEKERQLEKMRKEFIADVSHELKTPIALIKGYAEGIQDEILDKEEAVKIIIDESDKMTKLVMDMINLSQLENGTFKMKKERFNLSETIKAVADKSKALCYDRKIELKEKVDDNLYVYGDNVRLEQVLLNYLSNGIRHCYDEGEIIVTATRKDNDVLVEVENTGDHIDDNDIDKIWEKFYKVDKGRKRDGSTGLGLSITKNIINVHGGKVAVENTEKGVKFSFIIPYSSK